MAPACIINFLSNEDTLRLAAGFFITNQNDRKRNADVQVKSAKDFVPAAAGWERQGFSAMCWFSLRPPAAIKASNRVV
jgi:hypothetical protein